MNHIGLASEFYAPQRGVDRAHTKARLTDYYAFLLVILLSGLAIGGKGFAYLGFPPIYVTEMVLALGLLAWSGTGCLAGSLATMPGLVLIAMILWAASRTIPYLSVYGADALRDSVLVFYGLFAFVVAGLLLERPGRLLDCLRYLRWFTGVYAFAGPAVFLLQSLFGIPQLPVWSARVADLLRSDELAVHLSACAVLALLGFRRAKLLWLIALLFGITLVGSQSRGGLLAFVVPVALAAPFSRHRRQLAAIALATLLVLGIGYAGNVGLPKYHSTATNNERALTVREAVDNVISMAASGEDQQDATKRWREEWWRKIVDYTVHGPYFWTGKGFGINLAESDGFVAGTNEVAPLRAPHSCHFDILGREGVPGLALWVLFLCSWLGTIFRTVSLASRNGHAEWRNLLVFTACYWLASLIDASFDVALEGPMIGVWFWCQTGFGIAIVSIYDAGLMDLHRVLIRRVLPRQDWSSLSTRLGDRT
jgi:hypothetical protein